MFKQLSCLPKQNHHSLKKYNKIKHSTKKIHTAQFPKKITIRNAKAEYCDSKPWRKSVNGHRSRNDRFDREFSDKDVTQQL